MAESDLYPEISSAEVQQYLQISVCYRIPTHVLLGIFCLRASAKRIFYVVVLKDVAVCTSYEFLVWYLRTLVNSHLYRTTHT